MAVAFGIKVLGHETYGLMPKPKFYLGLCYGPKLRPEVKWVQTFVHTLLFNSVPSCTGDPFSSLCDMRYPTLQQLHATCSLKTYT